MAPPGVAPTGVPSADAPMTGVATPDFSLIFHAFLPPHELGERDPFGIVEALLTGIASNPGAISLRTSCST